MPKNFLRRYLPDPTEVRKHPALRPLGVLLNNPEIWHLHRRSVAGATFIGLFCAFLPIPFQMLVAGVLAVASRCNLPIAVALVWITNPLTMAPMFYFAYRLGAWMLNMQLEVQAIELSFDWLLDNLDTIGYPLLFGSLLCGFIGGIMGFVMVRVSWRMHVIRRWKERRASRKQRRETKPRTDSTLH